MLTDELLELAGNVIKNKAEGQTLEVKAAAKDCPGRLYDTLSSFSDQDMGGRSSSALTRRPASSQRAYTTFRTCSSALRSSAAR